MQIAIIFILLLVIIISVYLAIGIPNIEGLDTINQTVSPISNEAITSAPSYPTTAIPSTTSNITNVPVSTNSVSVTSIPTITQYQTDSPLSTTPYPTISNITDTALPTTAIPTTAIPTTAIPTTPYPTTALPTTPYPTTALPTISNITDTALPTTPYPTTPYPTTPYPTTPYPTTALPTISNITDTALPTTPYPTTPYPTTALPTISNITDTVLPTTAIPTTPYPTTKPYQTDTPLPTIAISTIPYQTTYSTLLNNNDISPTTAAPTTAAPTTAAPTTAAPTTAEPTTAAPTTAAPTTAAPTTAAPTTAAPTTAAPTTAIPTTAIPTTAIPTTAIPTTAAPTTAAPTTAAPTTAAPTTAAPIINGILYTCNNPSLKEYNNTNVCKDISYKDPITNKIYKTKGIIDPQYYLDVGGILTKLQPNKISTSDSRSYVPRNNKSLTDIINFYKTIIAKENIKDQKILSIYQNQIDELTKEINKNYNDNIVSNSKYDSNNFNMTYHATNVTNQTDVDSAGVGKMWVKDKTGRLISVPYNDVKNTTVYYQAGSYPFGPSSYVPKYEESVYLSKLTNESTTSLIKDYPFQKAGFCQGTSSNIEKEQKCNSLDKNICASTDCCVLLGGEKCVAGDKFGPTDKKNYSNFLLNNRDFYYYKGKCYGNCT
jgi:hypothetical protein